MGNPTYLLETITKDEITLSLYNTNGSLVLNETKHLYAGVNKGVLLLSNIPSGIYFLKIEGKHVNVSKRIVVNK